MSGLSSFSSVGCPFNGSIWEQSGDEAKEKRQSHQCQQEEPGAGKRAMVFLQCVTREWLPYTFEMWKTCNVFASFVGNHSWILSFQQSKAAVSKLSEPELRTTRLTVLVRVLRYLAVSFCDAVWFTPFLGFHSSGECP